MEEKPPTLSQLFAIDRKKVALIAVVSALIITILVVVISRIYASTHEEQAIEKEMTWFKCRSICPTEIKTLPTLTNITRARFLDASCESYCKRRYYDPYKLLIDSILKSDSTSTRQFGKFQRAFALCQEYMQRDLDFDYQGCFTQLFESAPKFPSLNNITLPDYKKYPSFALHLSCFEAPEVVMNHTSGDPRKGKIELQITTTDAKSIRLKDLSPPMAGESKHYALNESPELASKQLRSVAAYYQEGNASYFIEGAICAQQKEPRGEIE